MTLSFYRAKSHLFQNRKQLGFSRFVFSANRNPGFEILPLLETLRLTNLRSATRAYEMGTKGTMYPGPD